jgi:hypothetical protein
MPQPHLPFILPCRQYAPLSGGDGEDDKLIQLQPTTSLAESSTRGGNGGVQQTQSSLYQDLANGEGSPAYRVLANLLTDEFRLQHAGQLNIITSNASRASNVCTGSCCCCFGVRTFNVADGCIRLAEDGSGKFLIYGSGVHRVARCLFLTPPPHTHTHTHTCDPISCLLVSALLLVPPYIMPHCCRSTRSCRCNQGTQNCKHQPSNTAIEQSSPSIKDK